MLSARESGIRTTLLTVVLVTIALGFGVATGPALADTADSDIQQDDGWELTVNGTLTADGEFTDVDTAVVVNDTQYEQLRTTAAQQGYENAAALLGATFTNADTYGGYENPDVTRVADGYRLSFDFTDVDIDAGRQSTVTIDGNTIRLTIGGVSAPASNPSLSEITYRYTMPGEITETNAYEVDGNTAIYRLHRETPETLTIESRRGTVTDPGSESPEPGSDDAGGWTYDFNSTVTADGDVTDVFATITVDDTTYEQLESLADQRGLENAAVTIAQNTVESSDTYGDYASAEVNEVPSGYELTVEYANIDVERSDDSEITVEDGTVSVRVGNVTDPGENVDEITYRYNMPGEITQTNAIRVEGNTAVFELHEERPETLEIEAQTGAEDSDSDDEEDDDDEDESSGFGNGFGFGTALVALVTLGVLAGSRFATE